MKRIGVFLFLIFIGTFCRADTIDIHWGMDNQTYDTTTCTVGGDVALPATTPTKRGHTFLGWQAEHFNRGTFATWTDVPTDISYYTVNIYNNKKPLKNDYMIIENAGDYFISTFNAYFELYNTTRGTSAYQTIFAWRQNNIEHKIQIINYTDWSAPFGPNDEIQLTRTKNGRDVTIKANKTIRYNNKEYTTGMSVFKTTIDDTTTAANPYVFEYTENPEYLSGTWQFVYDGVWETDGKNGWKPDYQIVEENE